MSPEAAELLPAVRFHDYVGVVADEAVADSIRSCLGAGKVLFLRNKGVTIAAATIPEAWYLMKRVITACQTQVRAFLFCRPRRIQSPLLFNFPHGRHTPLSSLSHPPPTHRLLVRSLLSPPPQISLHCLIILRLFL